jgi:hypothetical protein
MRTALYAALLAACGLRGANGDAGVLVPAGRQQPDPGVFSLDEMTIDVHIDNGDARVSVRQIFGSHTDSITEGSYTFALPTRSMVSDFAVWDGLTRIPGVILERRRAEEIYENLKQQAIDPGLLQEGERDVDEARRSSVFSARIVPIPAFGTKRIEIEYHERVPVDNLRTRCISRWRWSRQTRYAISTSWATPTRCAFWNEARTVCVRNSTGRTSPWPRTSRSSGNSIRHGPERWKC